MTEKSLLDAYEKDGYVLLPNVLDAELIGEAQEHVEWLQRKYPNLRPEQLSSNEIPVDPFEHRLVSDARLLEIVDQFIGPDIALFATHYICKPPRDGVPVLWHQDGSFWPLDPMNVITLWVAVDDSLPENGCMQVIPGTHTMELQQLRENKSTANALNYDMDPDMVDESKAVNCVLKAGGVSVHHPNTIHGSKANLSPLRRCGLTIRYIPTSTRIMTEGQWPSSYLLRGREIPGVNHYLGRPKYFEGLHMPFRDSYKYK